MGFILRLNCKSFEWSSSLFAGAKSTGRRRLLLLL